MAPHSDDRKPWKPLGIPDHRRDESASSGNIVFHDAWPDRWPKLHIDIINNHHTNYYQADEKTAADHPPGDWESPTLVSFLAIGRGETFSFALSKRRSDVAEELLDLARKWLIGALLQEGAGAKTAAGYGRFRLEADEQPPRLESPARATFETTLELVTPAFLAGANQQAEDCDLRPATLRGLLRWWWRTMHAGFVDVATLRRLETAVWGDVNTGGSVRIAVEGDGKAKAEKFEFKKLGQTRTGKRKLDPDQDALRLLGVEPPPRFTTQDLYYASYGMDEISRNERRSRW
ncbi:MAG: type III-B CRISPR module RAMP protein Cmr6 [Pirellulaceae bacterium]